MVELAGQFAGIAKVTLPRDKEAGLRTALSELAKTGLEVTIQSATTPESGAHYQHCRLSIVGNDRPGIVREVSRALKERHINVIEMSSNISSIPMSGEPLFEAHVHAEMPENTDTQELQDALDDIADQLSLDIVME
jgi:glycine cleavage system regulatory protein